MPDPLRLYLDQCLSLEVSQALGEEGHDIVRAADVGQSRADDAQILNQAIGDGRILVTLDEHFGNWAVLPLKYHPWVIRLKIHPATGCSRLWSSRWKSDKKNASTLEPWIFNHPNQFQPQENI